jgi:2-polyprenyl-6-methoxyphenol hydroxylase-like FAD-dependent oxidoreductase
MLADAGQVSASRSADVVVVGAGIAGTTAALLMARSGASVTLVDRMANAGAEGAGILLQPNGLAVLAGLGLDAPLREAGCQLRHQRLFGCGTRPLTEAGIPDFGRGLNHLLAVRRSALHEVLLAAVAQQSAIACRFGATVTGCTPQASVEMQWHGRKSTIHATLVIGADGVHSTVRTGGHFGARLRSTGRSYLRGLVPRIDMLNGEYWTRLGSFGGAPVDADTTYFFAAARASRVAAAVQRGDLAALRAQWAAALPIAGDVLARVHDMTSLLHSDVVRIDCERWHDDRLVLVGDAAHAMAPTAGQGANSALVDAAVLTTELAVTASPPEALDRYCRRRREATRIVQNHADVLTRLSELRRPVARRARDLAVRVLTQRSGGAERVVRTLQQEDPAALFDTVSALNG